MNQSITSKSNKATHNMIAKNAGQAVKAIDPLAVISETLEFLKVRTEEETKRQHIEAKRDVLVTALNNEKEVILSYFERKFSERAKTLDELYQLLQRSATEGNGDNLHVALTGILGIIQENPLKDFAEFKKAMSDPNSTIIL